MPRRIDSTKGSSGSSSRASGTESGGSGAALGGAARSALGAAPFALVEAVRKNASIDWTIRESVKSKMRVAVKKLLKKYGYPPDMALLAIDRVLDQAEVLAEDLHS